MIRRNISLRQLLTMFRRKIMKSKNFLLRSEPNELVNYILNNSTLKLTAESLVLSEGCYMRVRNENKGREIKTLRFLTFKFSKQDVLNSINNTNTSWLLQSYRTFRDLEQSVSNTMHYSNDRRRVCRL